MFYAIKNLLINISLFITNKRETLDRVSLLFVYKLYEINPYFSINIFCYILITKEPLTWVGFISVFWGRWHYDCIRSIIINDFIRYPRSVNS